MRGRRDFNQRKHQYRCYIYIFLSAVLILVVLEKYVSEYSEGVLYDHVFHKRSLLQTDRAFDNDEDHFADINKTKATFNTTKSPKRLKTTQQTTALPTTNVPTTFKISTLSDLTSKEPNISCALPAISEFPNDLFTQQQRRNGGLLFHLVVTLYMFLGLAIVCDYYFVSSLEVIVYKLRLQADVAGASLMAIGSSAPELFASLIGVFITKGDIGIGTILGSAVFNVLFVLGFCGILATKDLNLSWWPVTRDSLCYAFTLIILTAVIFDGAVTWRESAFMVMVYIAYLVLMWYNERIEKRFYEYIDDKVAYKARFHRSIDEESIKINEEDTLSNDNIFERSTQTQFDDSSSTDSDDEAYPDDPPKELFYVPSTDLGKIAWLFALPINAIFYLTIPDIRRRQCRSYNTLTFFMSILWIGFLTYVLIWMVTVIGFTFSVPDSVMGLTFIAFGSSVPDALASILVARQGKGDMAVSQALGSNVFDILFGLGLPWLIKTLIFDLDSTIEVQSIGMLMSCFIIFCLVLAMLAALSYKKFVLSRQVGIVFIVAYALFLIVSVIMEIYVWSRYELPQCRTHE